MNVHNEDDLDTLSCFQYNRMLSQILSTVIQNSVTFL